MSRFISGGTYTEDSNNGDEGKNEFKNTADFQASSARDEAWLAAQKRINAAKQSTGSGSLGSGTQDGGKSLFEVLQANKAAKQEAQEEALKLSNQFRSLDEDEIAFLDSVAATSRAQEAAEKREQKEQLDAFRRLQAESASSTGTAEAGQGRASSDDGPRKGADERTQGEATAVEGMEWKIGGSGNARKRKKAGGGVIAGVKVQRTSSSVVEDDAASRNHREGNEKIADSSVSQKATQRDVGTNKQETPSNTGPTQGKISSNTEVKQSAAPTTDKPLPPATTLGLGAYSSSEEDE